VVPVSSEEQRNITCTRHQAQLHSSIPRKSADFNDELISGEGASISNGGDRTVTDVGKSANQPSVGAQTPAVAIGAPVNGDHAMAGTDDQVNRPVEDVQDHAAAARFHNHYASQRQTSRWPRLQLLSLAQRSILLLQESRTSRTRFRCQTRPRI
jgi:hypothetical protein